jgi:predicted enzyme involved in methoxymalonyl-ACP biosynthesis
MELEKKLREFEEKEALTKREAEERAKAEEEAKHKEEVARLSEKYTKEYTEEFMEALSSTKLPRSPTVVAKVAEKMQLALDQGYELSAKQAVKLVEKEIAEYKKALLKDMDEELLAEFLGEDGIKKIRQRDLKNLKNPVPKPAEPKQDAQVKEDEPRTPEEWLRSIKRQHGILK